jgi:hypothetical protein
LQKLQFLPLGPARDDFRCAEIAVFPFGFWGRKTTSWKKQPQKPQKP